MVTRKILLRLLPSGQAMLILCYCRIYRKHNKFMDPNTRYCDPNLNCLRIQYMTLFQSQTKCLELLEFRPILVSYSLTYTIYLCQTDLSIIYALHQNLQIH